jgi:MFS transporter, DHA2 family, multidrug resistance protein
MNYNTPKATRREWIGLAVIALPCLLYSMDFTVLHLAVPALSADLAPSSSQLLWIVDIYGFLIAGSLITMGTLGDRIGRRRLLLIGAAAFGVASVLAAFSTSAEMLIATRALLGFAGATLAPSTLSLIRNMFHDPRQRTIAIGVWITSFSVGGAIGPLAGGLVLGHFWWGAVFLLGVPVMVLLLAVGPVLLPESRDSKAGRLDLTSAALSLAAVLTVIYGFKQIAQDGLGWLPVLSILAGLTVGVVFLRRQQKLADPLIDLHLFRLPAFSASLATTILGFFTSFGAFLFIAQYLQLVLGLSPLQAGLWTLPQSGGFILGSLLAPVVVRRVRPAFVMAAGLALAAAGCGVLTQIDDISGLTVLVTGSAILSFGLAPVVTLATDLIVGAAPPERAGAASAISETSSEFGGALGIAILGSIGAAVYRSEITNTVPTLLPPEAADAARGTLGGALAAAGQLPDQLAAELLSTARNAFVQAFELTAAIGAVGLLITAIMAAVMLRGARSNAEFAAQPELTPDDGQSQEISGSSLIFQPQMEGRADSYAIVHATRAEAYVPGETKLFPSWFSDNTNKKWSPLPQVNSNS